MKKTQLLSVAAILLASCCVLAETPWKLPAPQREGGMPLMQALNERATKRSYSSAQFTDQQISDLLWSANGVNRQNGKRTAPSAVNRQEISLYLLTDKGVYLYDANANTLLEVNKGDFRQWAGKFQAPIYLALVADLKKAASKKYAMIDTGYVSQNIYLYCASIGAGTCAIGSFDRIKGSEKGKKLHQALKLGKDQVIMLTHSVGAVK